MASILPAFLYASVHPSTELQFISASSERDNVQVRGAGANAKLELLFQWQDKTSGQKPSQRDYSPIAYSSGTNVVVLFGGRNPSVLNDTWECSLFNPDNPSWSEQIPLTKPSARFGHILVPLDDKKVLLFGGYGTDYSSETWIYDSDANYWLDKSSQPGPSSRKNSCAALDTNNKKVVLFGGFGTANSSQTWIFDVANQTWSIREPLTAPSARYNASMTFSSYDNKIYLFGGNDGSRKNDLWRYDISLDTWAQITQNFPPTEREGASMFYDDRNSALVLWGGILNDATFDNRVYYYNFSESKWYDEVPMSTPTARMNQGLVYIPQVGKALIFGGFASGQYFDDTQYYVYRSSGIFRYNYIDGIDASQGLQWQKIEIPPPGMDYVDFQVASSTDNISYIFRGINGSTTEYYSWAGVPISLWSGHDNQRYLQYKAVLIAVQPPQSPEIESITVTYNHTPSEPSLYAPLYRASTNYITPRFTWFNSSDLDILVDTITYEFRLYDNLSLVTSSAGIVQGSNSTSLISPALLTHSTYYWEVQAFDSSVYSNWSGTYTLFVDTIAPSQVTDLTASTGAVNGQAMISWTSPGDDNLSGNIVKNDRIKVFYSTYVPVNESLWEWEETLNLTEGQKYSSFPVNGLENATTYYFAVKIGDEAGNYSVISSSSNPVFTNAPPYVRILKPEQGTTWYAYQEIQWIYSDPNPQDVLTFSLYASTDAGASYGTIISRGLPDGTTYYLWDTRKVINGSSQTIKITAIDYRGLSGSDTTRYFTITNVNEPPFVYIITPSTGQSLSGTVELKWSVLDYNGVDTHTYDLYLSADGGNTYPWHFTTLSTSYLLNTKSYPNGPDYSLKVMATDSGSPQATGQDQRNFIINNLNLPPNEFSLLYPADGTAHTPICLQFGWENTGDPNPEDTLFYTLYCSTNSDFSFSNIISSITDNTYRINPKSFTIETTYYWKVAARDPLGLTKQCKQNYYRFILNRTKATSVDGRVEIEFLSPMPSDGYLKIESINTLNNNVIQLANQDTIGDRNIKSLGENAYRISICDINEQELSVSQPQILLTMSYPDQNSDNYYDGTKVKSENLRFGILNESSNKWELAPSFCGIDSKNKKIAVTLNKLGIITMLGALSPASKISGVVNYPNPFAAGRESTKIRYVLTEDCEVTVNIYTLLGDLVSSKKYLPGSEGGKGQETGYTNTITWDGRNNSGFLVANGMYIIEIKSGSARSTRKIGVVK